MRRQRLAHQPLGRRQRAGLRPVGAGQGQQLAAVEQPRLQLGDRLETLLGQPLVQPRGIDRLPLAVVVESETIAQLVEQPPFEGAQQRLQRPAAVQRRQGRGVVLEQRGMGVFRRQQAHQQLVEVQAAEQRVAAQQVRNAGRLEARHRLQFAGAAQFQLQRQERPRQAAGLAARRAQHGAQTPTGGEEVHQGAAFLVGTRVQDEGEARLSEHGRPRAGGNGNAGHWSAAGAELQRSP